MDYVQAFLSYLSSSNNCSRHTLKNYRADILQFIRWYEESISMPFRPEQVTPGHILFYAKTTTLSKSSLARHLSSLRKFFWYLNDQGYVTDKKFVTFITKAPVPDAETVKDFTIYLFYQKASQVTIKQYRIDVNQFVGWAKKKLGVKTALSVHEQIAAMNTQIVNSYINYLVSKQGYSVSTVTRKKAAINTYIDWILQENKNAP